MKLSIALITLAATLGSGAAFGDPGQVMCCQLCDNGVDGNPICSGWGINAATNGQTGPAPIVDTVAECADKEYFAYVNQDNECHETGYPGMAGDCYSGRCDWNSWIPEASRRPVTWCIANGYDHFELFYQGGMCMSTDMAMTKFGMNTAVAAAQVIGKAAGIEGDPHIKTWGGKWFDYHGECDLVLLNAPEFAPETPLSVHVRTKLRYQYSYIEAAVVALGDDTFELGSFGDYALNGVESANLAGQHVAGYPLYHTEISDKQHKFDIVINVATNITLTNFKDLVAVKLTGAGADHFGSASGIMGNYEGELVGRDGSVFTVENANEFGQEWQVGADEPMLFRTARSPQAPQQCTLPSGVIAQKRLGQPEITKEAAEAACSGHAKKENCVVDVMAAGDVDIAKAF